MINYKQFTVGIEEEYMVIDPATKALISHEQKIVAEGQKIISEKVKAEMHQAVVEVGTDVCANIEEARHDIYNLRKTIHGIAECQLCKVFPAPCVCPERQLPFLGREGDRLQIIQNQSIR